MSDRFDPIYSSNSNQVMGKTNIKNGFSELKSLTRYDMPYYIILDSTKYTENIIQSPTQHFY